MTLRSLSLTLCLLSSIASSQAIEVANYSDATNKRFPTNSSFIGNAFDLSGVGRAGGSWGTAIGDNYFLSANHARPATNSTITFTKDNAGSPNSFSYNVAGGFRIGTTDLWLGYTSAAIDPTIARYDFATQNANNLIDVGLGASTLLISGDQVPGIPGTVADHILGTNQAESFYNEGSGQISTPGETVQFTPPPGFENDFIIAIENLPGDDAPPLTHESVVEGGDSGSPLFSTSGNNLTILGVTSLLLNGIPGNFVNTFGPDPVEQRSGTAFSYVGSYTSELNATIALVPTPVPEPSALTLIAIAIGFSIRRKR